MKLGLKVREKIAQAIAEHFTTNQIVAVFTDANIPADKSLYAKKDIVLDAFGKISSGEEAFFYILNEFCHPLNFQDKGMRLTFIEKLRIALSYEDIEVQMNERNVLFIRQDKSRESQVYYEPQEPAAKTSTDYIVEAMNFFKDEYNKVKLSGLTYDYPLGENANSDQTDGYGKEGYSEKLRAIMSLQDAGIITWYKVEDRVENDGYYIWDYAVCKVDESKLLQKEVQKTAEKIDENFERKNPTIRDIPRAADYDISSPQKVVHEHTHKFENSIQEKEINLTHKIVEDPGKKKTDNGKNKTTFYLTPSGDLYREPKTKHCYQMGEKDDRHKVVRFLITNKGYQATSQIAAQFEDKREDSVIDTIGKFNSVAKGKLSIKDNIVLGKKGSGYKMNPAYTFLLKNE